MSTPIVIDSWGWLEYLTDGPLASRYAAFIENATPQTHVTPAIVLYEVYRRLCLLGRDEMADAFISEITRRTRVVDVVPGIAVLAARLSLATHLSQGDALILATAQREGAEIVTSDPHFKEMSGVKFIR